jgi:hypothetical protein
MATTSGASRFGTWLLVAGCLALAGLMVYTLALPGHAHRPAPAPAEGTIEVAVFFPDEADWHDFRQGVETCRARGLVRDVREGPGEVVVASPRYGRRVRFAWNRAPGRSETRQEVRRLVAGASPPVAVVGSGNTDLTAALAEALREAAEDRGPVLLVPWASTLDVRPPGGGPAVPLLEIDRGRTFRFCPDNRRAANLVVRCVLNEEPASRPERVVVVEDPADPYSADLADCFRRAIREAVPGVEPEVQADALHAPGLADLPDDAERRWAEDLWHSAHDAARRGQTWVVLPLQAEPARRLLAALRGAARFAPAGGPRLQVLCGDAIGLEALSGLDGPRTLPVWCASPASQPRPVIDVAHDAQIPAEIVTALVRCLDVPHGGPPPDLGDALHALEIPADDPSAMGRSLAFTAEGERRGEDLGLVLAIRPGQAEIKAYRRRPGGRWDAVVSIPPVSVGSAP